MISLRQYQQRFNQLIESKKKKQEEKHRKELERIGQQGSHFEINIPEDYEVDISNDHLL